MKNLRRITLVFAGSVFIGNLCFAQQVPDTINKSKNDTTLSKLPFDEYKDDLTEGFVGFDTSGNLSNMLSASNHLVLIAKKWPDRWESNYYACYSLIILSYVEKDNKRRDLYLDDAEVFLNKFKNLYKTEYDEMYVLEAMFDNARLAVNPMNRYKKYGDLFNSNIEKAKTLQPNNPRIYFLQGNSIYYTPKMFGGGPVKALPYFENAAVLYDKESGTDIYKPYWGKKQNSFMLNKCREAAK